MKILVTGGGGFLGRHIVKRLLARGDQIAILGRKPQPDLIEKGISMIQADIADESAVVEACRDQDVVYHVAALAGIWGPRKNYFNANVLGTRNILKGCRKHRVSKLVYTSTPSVVFNRNHLRNADESTPYGSDWLCHYAETKAIAESEVLAANHSDFRTVALRPHLIWGPGDNH